MLTQFPEHLEYEQNPAAAYLASLPSEQSQRAMRAALNNVVLLHGARPTIRHETDARGRKVRRDVSYLYFNWAALRFHHVVSIRTQLAALYRPASVNKMLSAIRGVLLAARDMELISAEDYQRVLRIRSFKLEPRSPGHDISKRDMKALVRVCKKDKSPAGARDAAVIGILYTCGLRPSELVHLDLEDYDRASGALSIRKTAQHKARTVYVTGRARRAADLWLITRNLWPGPLFCAINKAGQMSWQGVTTQALYKMLKKRSKQAKIREISAHDLRRSFINALLKEGIDLVTVARLADHSSLYSTARYAERSPDALRKASNVLHFPF